MAKKKTPKKSVTAEPITKQESAKADEAKEPEPEWKENLVAISVVLLVIILIYGFFVADWFSGEPPVPEQRFQIGTAGQPSLGADDAPVTLIQFSDYECPSCRVWHAEKFPRLKEEYIETGEVRFVYRDYPIETLHPDGVTIAAVAGCAGEQGAFWEFHDAFYEEEITEELINGLVEEHRLNATELVRCRNTGDEAAAVRQDILDGVNQGRVSGTPTFFINGKKLVGNRPWEEFTQLIEEELAPAE